MSTSPQTFSEASSPSAPIANPDEVDGGRSRLWLLSFGAYAQTQVYVWASSLETAFEVAVDYFDEAGQCGVFTILTEDDYAEAAEELGRVWDPTSPDFEVMERAEVDLTPTSGPLSCATAAGGAAFVASWEWTGREVHGAERAEVRERSWRESEEE